MKRNLKKNEKFFTHCFENKILKSKTLIMQNKGKFKKKQNFSNIFGCLIFGILYFKKGKDIFKYFLFHIVS